MNKSTRIENILIGVDEGTIVVQQALIEILLLFNAPKLPNDTEIENWLFHKIGKRETMTEKEYLIGMIMAKYVRDSTMEIETDKTPINKCNHVRKLEDETGYFSVCVKCGERWKLIWNE